MDSDWKNITDDELLGQAGINDKPGRYARIIQKRSTDAVTGLTETIDRASRVQSRQQWVLIALSLALVLCTAAYVWITWESVSAMREGNKIQRQLLEIQHRQQGRPTMPNS